MAKKFDKHPVKELQFILAFSNAIQPTVQPMMKFSQLICWGEPRLESKFKKKSVRQILSYFWFHILLVCKKSVLQIFILLRMNVKSDPISYSWNFETWSYW